MAQSELYIALIASVLLSLLIEELFGISTGGMITPGVFALNFRNLDILLFMLISSFIIYIIVDKLLRKVMILFGQREFAVLVILGLLFKIIIDKLYPFLPFAAIAFRGVSAIAPSLLANRYIDQGILYTLFATMVTSVGVFVILQLLFLF